MFQPGDFVTLKTDFDWKNLSPEQKYRRVKLAQAGTQGIIGAVFNTTVTINFDRDAAITVPMAAVNWVYRVVFTPIDYKAVTVQQLNDELIYVRVADGYRLVKYFNQDEAYYGTKVNYSIPLEQADLYLKS